MHDSAIASPTQTILRAGYLSFAGAQPGRRVSVARTPVLWLALIWATGWTALHLICVQAASIEEDVYQAPGTARMARRLEELTAKADPMKSLFLSRERVAHLKPVLE